MMRKTLALAISMFFACISNAAVNYTNVKSDTILPPSPADTVLIPFTGDAALSYQDLLYKSRLDSIQRIVPLTYNSHVQKYIDIYARRSTEIARVIGLSKYYFPIFDKSLKEFNIPEEIKFLSIVESSLDPLAVSRSGATGPWQFMFNTAKAYGLNIDSYVDERRDPAAASLAAAHYLKDAFEELGDWLLAIAAYNCGQGAVSRAIKKAGGINDFWAIRKYLPVETQNYVPAFIATTYIMNYYAKHDIFPDMQNNAIATDVVLVDKFVSFSAIANAIDKDVKELAALNPLYKKQVINGSPALPRTLILPYFDQVNYSALYDVLNSDEADYETEKLIASNSSRAIVSKQNHKGNAVNRYLTYKVKRGDTLSGIAEKFNGVTVSSIKSKNRLKGSSLQPGMLLKINRG